MITAFTASRVDNLACLLSWASDLPSPTFYLYRDGVLVFEGSSTSTLISVGADETPVFELVDDAGDEPTAIFPAAVTLAWYASSSAGSYRVDRLVGSDWLTQTTIPDTGVGYFTWTSVKLPDGVVTQFRVVPLSAGGIEGTARTFATLIVRYPDPPDVTYSYDDGAGVVTIAAV